MSRGKISNDGTKFVIKEDKENTKKGLSINLLQKIH